MALVATMSDQEPGGFLIWSVAQLEHAKVLEHIGNGAADGDREGDPAKRAVPATQRIRCQAIKGGVGGDVGEAVDQVGVVEL